MWPGPKSAIVGWQNDWITQILFHQIKLFKQNLSYFGQAVTDAKSVRVFITKFSNLRKYTMKVGKFRNLVQIFNNCEETKC